MDKRILKKKEKSSNLNACIKDIKLLHLIEKNGAEEEMIAWYDESIVDRYETRTIISAQKLLEKLTEMNDNSDECFADMREIYMTKNTERSELERDLKSLDYFYTRRAIIVARDKMSKELNAIAKKEESDGGF